MSRVTEDVTCVTVNVIGVLYMARPVIDLNMTFTGLITGGYDLGYRVMVAYVWYFDEEVDIEEVNKVLPLQDYCRMAWFDTLLKWEYFRLN